MLKIKSNISGFYQFQVAATFIRILLGLGCLYASLLWLLPFKYTSILVAVSILIIAVACFNLLRLAKREPKLRAASHISAYTSTALCLFAFILTLILGPGAFSPHRNNNTKPNDQNYNNSIKHDGVGIYPPQHPFEIEAEDIP